MSLTKAMDAKQFVLLVDDDPSTLELFEHTLGVEGIPTEGVLTGREALGIMEHRLPSAVVLDLSLPDIPGIEVLRSMRTKYSDVPIVVVTGTDDVATVVECMQLGACDFVQKPFDSTRFIASVKNAHERGQLRARIDNLEEASGLSSIVGESQVMRRTTLSLAKAIGTDVTVLLEGESGTGKELFARAIHFDSHRSSGPFVVVDCGSIPETLIESELFGHKKGSFSGAHQNRVGLFEQANGGTIFLDEIGELPGDLQVRLLRVIQERNVRPVGANRFRPIDVRIVVATNKILADEVEQGLFRRDLYYRLSTFPVNLPALRDRGDDVLLLATNFLEQTRKRLNARVTSISPEARETLRSYGWPGNVRELENVIERGVIIAEGTELGLESLPDEIVCASFDGTAETDRPVGGHQRVEHPEILTMEVEERRIFERALTLCDWNVREASERLGIGRATLYRRIHSYGLKPDPAPLSLPVSPHENGQEFH